MPSSPRAFNAYIDETGDEGWRKTGRRRFGAIDAASEWFILGAAILHAERDAQEARTVDELRKLVDRTHSKKPLHWVDLKTNHSKKRRAADCLGTQQQILV